VNDDDRAALLRHYLAALAYRFHRAVADAPDDFAGFRAGSGVRPPVEIVRHLVVLMRWAASRLEDGPRPAADESPPGPLQEEAAAFHRELERVSAALEAGAGPAAERLLQGPLADAMTHVGQLALLRRLAGSPVAAESFFAADIRADRLGPDQPPPARPFPAAPDDPEDG